MIFGHIPVHMFPDSVSLVLSMSNAGVFYFYDPVHVLGL